MPIWIERQNDTEIVHIYFIVDLHKFFSLDHIDNDKGKHWTSTIQLRQKLKKRQRNIIVI